MQMIKTGFMLSALLLAAVLEAAPLTLVQDGKPAATIVIGAKPTQSAQLAAFELQHQLQLITGAKLPVVSDRQPVPGTSILLGESEATIKLGLKKEDYTGEEYQIKFLPQTIVIIGNDFPGYAKVDYQKHYTFPALNYQDKPTLFGTYDFLERYCDVRYYAPADAGITFTPRKTLTVEPQDLRRQPYMQAFRMIYAPKFHYEYNKPFADRDNLLLKLRWRLSVRYGMANHNVYSLYFKYWNKAAQSRYAGAFKERHPEYFAQGYDGQSYNFLISDLLRRNYPNDVDLPPQPCQTHPDVIKHYAEEAVAAYNGEFAVGASQRPGQIPGTTWFYPIVEDDNNARCKCARCAAMFKDKDPSKRNGYIHYWWINEIAKAAAKINPAVGISTLAYHDSLYYPEDLKLESNVSVEMCIGVGTWWHPTVYKRHHDNIFNEWIKRGKGKFKLTLWTYMLSPGWDAMIIFKYNDFFPAFAPFHTGQYFKEFADKGIDGWFGESNDELGYPLWTNQLETYLAARLCDDPSIDYKKEIEDFFPRYYGAAASPMREFYRIIEDINWDYRNYPADWFKNEESIGPYGKMDNSAYAGFSPEFVNWGMLGTRERMNKLAALMTEARKLVKTDLEKQRLAWFDNGVWQPMERGRKNYEAKENFMKRPVPELMVPRISPVSGKLERIDWKNATSTGSWKTISGFPALADRQIQFAHDGEYLYGCFFESGDADKLKSFPAIWGGDVLELFFAATPARPYHHLAINPDGVSMGFFYRNENGVDFSGKWNSGAIIRTNRNKEGFTLLFALPLKNLLPSGAPRTDTVFYANFFRFIPEKISTGWSPTFEPSFHTPARMGKIILK